MFLRKLAVFALLSPVFSHHLGTSYKHHHDNRNANLGRICEDASTSSHVAPSSSAASTKSTTLSPTLIPTTTVYAAIGSAPLPSTTVIDGATSPTKSTSASKPSTSTLSTQCRAPINGCAHSKNIIAQSYLTTGGCFSLEEA
ncbi:hypothetical protein V496_01839 [Pseudogymnoascus sp. VKM F-4515 (FW-2607)]|nr:hypothetical protein V496_01839 [Pseudogymnoascus sp. VKM F-4515 (FW-2607)]